MLGVLPRALAVVEMRQDALDHGGVVAMTFMCPPQVSQVSISILNTRFRPCAHAMTAWRVDGGSSRLVA